jgi:hypothetical protein
VTDSDKVFELKSQMLMHFVNSAPWSMSPNFIVDVDTLPMEGQLTVPVAGVGEGDGEGDGDGDGEGDPLDPNGAQPVYALMVVRASLPSA